jgi:hypothetical protein
VTWAGLDHQLFYAVADATDRCVDRLLDLSHKADPNSWSDVHPDSVRALVDQPTSAWLATLAPASTPDRTPRGDISAEQAAASAALGYSVQTLRRVREAQLIPRRARLARARDISVEELAAAVETASAELRTDVRRRRLPVRVWRTWRVRRWTRRASRRVAVGEPFAVFDALLVTPAGFHAAADYLERVARRRAEVISAMVAVERGYLAECTRLRQAADRDLAPLVHLSLVRRSA